MTSRASQAWPKISHRMWRSRACAVPAGLLGSERRSRSCGRWSPERPQRRVAPIPAPVESSGRVALLTAAFVSSLCSAGRSGRRNQNGNISKPRDARYRTRDRPRFKIPPRNRRSLPLVQTSLRVYACVLQRCTEKQRAKLMGIAGWGSKEGRSSRTQKVR